jgi:hypothetical protein
LVKNQGTWESWEKLGEKTWDPEKLQVKHNLDILG